MTPTKKLIERAKSLTKFDSFKEGWMISQLIDHLERHMKALEKCKVQRDIELEDNCWSEIKGGAEIGRPFNDCKEILDKELEAILKGE